MSFHSFKCSSACSDALNQENYKYYINLEYSSTAWLCGGNTRLTAWYNYPYEVEEEIVRPEVVSLWSEVRDTLESMVEEAGGIIKYVAIYLA